MFGIVAQEKPYRLAWFINHHNPFQFVRVEDYTLEINGRNCEFAQFAFNYEENHTQYTLVSNRDEGHLLIPELKHCDYLLIIKGATDFFEEAPFKELFKQIPVVQFIYPADPNKFKSKTNLMYL